MARYYNSKKIPVPMVIAETINCPKFLYVGYSKCRPLKALQKQFFVIFYILFLDESFFILFFFYFHLFFFFYYIITNVIILFLLLFIGICVYCKLQFRWRDVQWFLLFDSSALYLFLNLHKFLFVFEIIIFIEIEIEFKQKTHG